MFIPWYRRVLKTAADGIGDGGIPDDLPRRCHNAHGLRIELWYRSQPPPAVPRRTSFVTLTAAKELLRRVYGSVLPKERVQ